MKSIMVLASYPAPYRVAVFDGLSKYYNLDVFFSVCNDQDRNREWFVDKNKFNYYVITEDSDFVYFNKCVKNLKQYDLVLAYDWYLPFALKVELKAIRAKIPYIINCDGAFIGEKNLKDFIKIFFVKHAAACLSSGMHAEQYFLHYGAKKEKIYNHNFTSLTEEDILQEPVCREEKKKIRKKLNLPQKITVLSIGQFIPRKGFDMLLEAWKKFDHSAQLILIGGGPEKDNYIKIIANNGYENVIIIDYQSKENIFEYYKAADLFVLPTREDIWGLVINEAMACGLPVISTDQCVAAIELLNYRSDLSVMPIEEGSEGLERRIDALLTDKKELERMSLANIEKIKNFTLNRLIQDNHDVIAMYI